MRPEPDAGARRVLERFGVSPGARLGEGGEAWVFALDAERVLRVSRPHARLAAIELRNAMVRELGESAHRVPFAIPEVLEVHTIEGRLATIETRLPGRTLADVIAEARGDAREALVRAYLEAASRIGDLALERPFFGEIATLRPLQEPSFRSYLKSAAMRSLAVAGDDFAAVPASDLAAALPEPDAPSFVHLDAFPGNMLGEDGRVTAVLDFGPLAIVGDRRLDPLTAAAYLAAEITPVATQADREVAQRWLAEQGLAALFDPAQRWLAAFWSGAVDDAHLQKWSRRVLGIPSSP